MNKILVLLMTALLLTSTLFAGGNNRSTLRIRLSDGSPLMVTINGRDFNKIGRSITIGDLPGKRQYLQVYKYRRYADGKGGKAELAFDGKIKIEKGFTYDCIVDLGSGKIRMREVASLQPLVSPPAFNPNQSQVLEQGQQDAAVATPAEDNNTPMAMPPTQDVDAKLLPLKKAMGNVDADSKKLELALNYVNKSQVNSLDVKNIATWIFFDDNRMKFVKQAYPKVTDKNNYSAVASVFTLDESKKEFNDFLKQK